MGNYKMKMNILKMLIYSLLLLSSSVLSHVRRTHKKAKLRSRRKDLNSELPVEKQEEAEKKEQDKSNDPIDPKHLRRGRRNIESLGLTSWAHAFYAMDVVISEDAQGNGSSTEFYLSAPNSIYSLSSLRKFQFKISFMINGKDSGIAMYSSYGLIVPTLGDLRSKLKSIKYEYENPEFKRSSGNSRFINQEEYLKLKKVLHYGFNSVEYVVSYAIGLPFATQTNQAGAIYYYPFGSKFILSDVDGTITKEDLSGHVSDFTDEYFFEHADVINENMDAVYRNLYDLGYNIIYLSSRPLNMQPRTKKNLFLRDRKVNFDCPTQTNLFGKTAFPLGPLFLRNMESAAIAILLEPDSINFKTNLIKSIVDVIGTRSIRVGLGNNIRDHKAYTNNGFPNILIVEPFSHSLVVKGSRKRNFVPIYADYKEPEQYSSGLTHLKELNTAARKCSTEQSNEEKTKCFEVSLADIKVNKKDFYNDEFKKIGNDKIKEKHMKKVIQTEEKKPTEEKEHTEMKKHRRRRRK